MVLLLMFAVAFLLLSHNCTIVVVVCLIHTLVKMTPLSPSNPPPKEKPLLSFDTHIIRTQAAVHTLRSAAIVVQGSP